VDKLSQLWLDSASAALSFVGDARVRGRWVQPSTLPRMSVGALAGHLVDSGILQAEEGFVLAEGPAGQPITAARMLSWVPLDEGSPVHDGVRSAAEAHAVEGSEELIGRARASLERSEAVLARASLDAVIAHPWAPSLPITLFEFLGSRILELVVHVDDLAHSVGVEELPFCREAIELACHIGIDINVERYGPTAVLRSLFRRDRNSLDALRTF